MVRQSFGVRNHLVSNGRPQSYQQLVRHFQLSHQQLIREFQEVHQQHQQHPNQPSDQRRASRIRTVRKRTARDAATEEEGTHEMNRYAPMTVKEDVADVLLCESVNILHQDEILEGTTPMAGPVTRICNLSTSRPHSIMLDTSRSLPQRIALCARRYEQHEEHQATRAKCARQHTHELQRASGYTTLSRLSEIKQQSAIDQGRTELKTTINKSLRFKPLLFSLEKERSSLVGIQSPSQDEIHKRIFETLGLSCDSSPSGQAHHIIESMESLCLDQAASLS